MLGNVLVSNKILTASNSSTLQAANTRRLLTDVIYRYHGHLLLLCASLQYVALEDVDTNLIATSNHDYRSVDTLDYRLVHHYCLCLTHHQLSLMMQNMQKMRVEM